MSSVDIEKMTKEEALEYLGLPSDANDFYIDEKFWKLSKQYRGKNDKESEDKLSELSAVYNIACGRRDEALRKADERAKASKFLGKTKDEWKNYFAYSWLKIVVIIAVALCIGGIIFSMFTNRYDASLVAFGHFEVDSSLLEDACRGDSLKKVYVTSVNIVVPNDQKQSKNIYADQTLSSQLNSYPNVLITDTMTYKYYFGYYKDMTPVYEDLKIIAPAELSMLTEPVYLSELEAFLYTRNYYYQQGLITEEEYYGEKNHSPAQIMVGLRVKDTALGEKIGVRDLWPDTEEGIIISMFSDTSNVEDSEKLIVNLLHSLARSN